jgi:hypothetical protein
VAFADESGTHGNTKCYGIGVVSVESDRLDGFVRTFGKLRAKHNVTGELKWEKIRNRFSDVNFILDWIDHILSSHTGYFDVIIVNTTKYRNWCKRDANRERAFYQTYTALLTHMTKRSGKITDVFIDERSDSYALQHEAMGVIGNRMLARLASSGQLRNVQRVRSKETPGIQVADVLTGLVVAAHARKLDSSVAVNATKALAITRAATMLGWDDLCYDTLPDSKFNIWHFPIQYRGQPATRRVIPARPAYVTRSDLR